MNISAGHRRLALSGAAVLTTAALVSAPAAASAHDSMGEHSTAFTQSNLVADQPGKAMITDPNLVNAWGMSHGPNTPLWVSDNGADVSTLYTAGVGGTGVAAVPLVVHIPGGAPTGQVFNDASGFDVPGTGSPALFIFAGEDGTISAWNKAAGTSAIAVAQPPNSVFKGMALVHSPFGPLLLVADFHNDQIDIFDSNFQQLPGGGGVFSDPRVPAGFAPFNVAAIGNNVVITYAKQDADRHDDVAGRGNGFVDVYTSYGALVERLQNHNALNSPWGLVVAPSTFGSFAGDLLVGNFGDGRIHAFDLRSGEFAGTLTDATTHHALAIDGLWGLALGDGVAGGVNSVWFSAGPNGEAHGLLGLLQPSVPHDRHHH
jgi:uncharacterized protein (TIGR03118 family)